jgi:hypothetical protein
MKKIKLLALVPLALLGACCAERDAAETALLTTMHQTWPSINAAALRDHEHRLTTGEINQAGYEILTGRNIAFDEALAELRRQEP